MTAHLFFRLFLFCIATARKHKGKPLPFTAHRYPDGKAKIGSCKAKSDFRIVYDARQKSRRAFIRAGEENQRTLERKSCVLGCCG